MNASFGIDHPLLATNDINNLRRTLIALGFNMTAIGKHPWGTSTSLAMFNGCLIEIMGIYDDSLIDEVPAGEFHFGRHVYAHLQQREGVALTALHSTNSTADALRAESAGFTVAGHLEFGRDVTLPDGSQGRTKTTLALLPDEQFPRLSFFLCQQHRPELIYVPEWLQHPNKITGICGINIIANEMHQPVLKQRFGGIYDDFEHIEGGFQFQTMNGVMRITDAVTFTQTIGPLPKALALASQDETPWIAGMDLKMSNPNTAHEFLKSVRKTAEIDYRTINNGFALSTPELTANTVLRFIE